MTLLAGCAGVCGCVCVSLAFYHTTRHLRRGPIPAPALAPSPTHFSPPPSPPPLPLSQPPGAPLPSPPPPHACKTFPFSATKVSALAFVFMHPTRRHSIAWNRPATQQQLTCHRQLLLMLVGNIVTACVACVRACVRCVRWQRVCVELCMLHKKFSSTFLESAQECCVAAALTVAAWRASLRWYFFNKLQLFCFFGIFR